MEGTPISTKHVLNQDILQNTARTIQILSYPKMEKFLKKKLF